MGIILFGHRGAAGEAPENTLGGFAYARQVGVRAFELDIHLSKDNELVVIHDATLERTTDGLGAVHDYTAAELKSLNAARLFPNWMSREGVPSLQDVLSRYHATIDHWQLEIKQDSEQNLAAVCALLARQIHHYHLGGRVTVTSFHPPALQSMHSVDARLRLGLIRSPIEMEDISLARSLNCSELCVPLQTGSQSLVSLAHSAGLRVTGWLGNDAPALDRLLAWGVDAITSDRPSFAAQYLAEVSPHNEER